jgi:RNA polymerase sigma-70 factor (ECF subfamily)
MDCDRELVLKASDGDRAAFAVLVERHHSLLEAMCRRKLGPSPAVEDAVQEAVLQALLSLDRLRQPERFGAWLAGIGLNIISRLADEIFYASVYIAASAGTVSIDARPSDAMALALALDAPIRVEADLFTTLAQSGKRSRADGEGAKEIVAVVGERLKSQPPGKPAEGQAPG